MFHRTCIPSLNSRMWHTGRYKSYTCFLSKNAYLYKTNMCLHQFHTSNTGYYKSYTWSLPRNILPHTIDTNYFLLPYNPHTATHRACTPSPQSHTIQIHTTYTSQHRHKSDKDSHKANNPFPRDKSKVHRSHKEPPTDISDTAPHRHHKSLHLGKTQDHTSGKY